MKTESENEKRTERSDEVTDEKETLVVFLSVALPEQEEHTQINTEGKTS